MVDFLEIYDVLQFQFCFTVINRMWIIYNKAPYDNGHPIGEEVQVSPKPSDLIQNELYNYLENGKDSAVEMFNALKAYHQVRANNIQNVERETIEMISRVVRICMWLIQWSVYVHWMPHSRFGLFSQ